MLWQLHATINSAYLTRSETFRSQPNCQNKFIYATMVSIYLINSLRLHLCRVEDLSVYSFFCFYIIVITKNFVQIFFSIFFCSTTTLKLFALKAVIKATLTAHQTTNNEESKEKLRIRLAF